MIPNPAKKAGPIILNSEIMATVSITGIQSTRARQPPMPCILPASTWHLLTISPWVKVFLAEGLIESVFSLMRPMSATFPRLPTKSYELNLWLRGKCQNVIGTWKECTGNRGSRPLEGSPGSTGDRSHPVGTPRESIGRKAKAFHWSRK